MDYYQFGIIIMLTTDAVGKDGKEHTSFFVAFDDALEVFYNSYEEINVKPQYLNTDKDRLLYALHINFSNIY